MVTVFLLPLKDSLLGESGVDVGIEPLAQLLEVDLVDVELKLLLQLVQILGWKGTGTRC